MTEVRLASAADLPAIASLHGRTFPASLASQLGPTWLAAVYRRRLDDPAARLYVVPRTGYLAATHPSASPLPLGAASRPAEEGQGQGARMGRVGLAASPPYAAALAHLLRTGQLPSWLAAAAGLALHGLRGRGAPRLPPDAATIDYLAVAPDRRGRGVGSALVEAALVDPAAAGLPWAVGAEADNAPALALYARHGFVPRERWDGYDGRSYVRLHRPSKR
jgi:ribosomal protein S18 acetylase RimI-like enzyme